MQLKNSFVLLTALTAGMASARLHGHDRRHAHHDKRAVGDMVYVTIAGKVESWANEFSGGAKTAAPNDAQPTQGSGSGTQTAAAAPAEPTDTIPATTGTPSAEWWSTPANGQYSREGFGKKTYANGKEYIMYKGNVGDPWGSNIIEVTPEKAKDYRHVVEFKGSNEDPWTVVFWNKMGPDGKLDGWYNGNAALKFTLEPGTTRYVAFDDDSQGSWGAAKGENLPTDQAGGYSCTWGEFDFANSSNNGWSGWDVSAIQAQAAGQEVQGMKICTHDNQKCSTVSRNAASVVNAYIKSLAAANGIGGNSVAGPLRLSAHLDFNE